MRKITLLVTIAMLSMVLSSCGTLFIKGGSEYRAGVASYEMQLYVDALEHLQEALRINGELQEAIQLFPIVYAEGTEYYQGIIAVNQGNETPDAADQVYFAYRELYALNSIAQASGRVGTGIEDVTQSMDESRIKAAKIRFEYAESLYAQEDRESLKASVREYEIVRERDPEFPNINEKIQTAIEQATVTLMVLGTGPIENFHAMMLEDITEAFASNRFVRIVETGDFSENQGGMVGPMDLAIFWGRDNDIDYLLEIYTDTIFTNINEETPVRLPSSHPLFNGTKKTIGYKNDVICIYRLFDISDVSVIHEDRLKITEGPYTYEFSYVPSEGLRNLNLQGTGEHNFRYVSTSVDEQTLVQSMGKLMDDYNEIFTPAGIMNPSDQTEWIKYYANRYDSFAEFIQLENQRELFYAVELVHHTPSDLYYPIGESVQAAIHVSNRNSAIMNALNYTARTLIEKAYEEKNQSVRVFGKQVGLAVKGLL